MGLNYFAIMAAAAPPDYNFHLHQLTASLVDQFIQEVNAVGPFRVIHVKSMVKQDTFGASAQIYWVPKQFCRCADPQCRDRLYIVRSMIVRVRNDFGVEALKNSLAAEYEWALKYRQ